MANQFLSLSLFLMLLSFFIVINSMSTFEQETAVPAVLNSLSLAFSRDQKYIKEYIRGPSAIPSPYEGGKGEGDTLETIEGLFNANIAGFTAKKNRLGTVMHVALPINDFERIVKTATVEAPQGGDADPMTFSQTMITLLRSAQGGKPYRLDMVYNQENDPMVLLRGAPDTFRDNLIRVSALAGYLERKGMPKKMMSVGLNKGKPGNIDLFFYRYKPLAVPDDIKQMQEEEKANLEAQERGIMQDVDEPRKQPLQEQPLEAAPQQPEPKPDDVPAFAVPPEQQ